MSLPRYEQIINRLQLLEQQVADSKKNSNIKTYTSPSQFGLSKFTSIAEICSAMPDNSKLIMLKDSNVQLTDFSSMTSGTVEITKVDLYRCTIDVNVANASDKIERSIAHWRKDLGLSKWVNINQT